MTTNEKSAARIWTYRAIAAGVPTLIGLTLIAHLLFRQGWLIVNEGRLVLTRPPLYLEEPGHELTGHRYLYDETLGWRNIPNWKATTYDRPLSINSKGLRDKDYNYEKPDNTKRILVLGDSYAWGYGVADNEVFSEVLEARLAGRKHPWEVINTGVSGWGTDQQLLFFTNEGIKYDPDIVLLAFFIGNDIDNNVAASQYELNKPVFVDMDLTLGNVPVPRPGQPISDSITSKQSGLDGVRLTTAVIKRISDKCAERGCEFVLMKFGIFLAPTLPYALDLERRFVASKEKLVAPLYYLDLDEAFQTRQLDAVTLTTGNDDGHWNAFGHEQVAIEIEQFLTDSGLLSQLVSQP